MATPADVQDDTRYLVRLRLPVRLGTKVIRPDHDNIVLTGAVIKQLAQSYRDAFENIVEAR
jgi:hypothetical protein